MAKKRSNKSAAVKQQKAAKLQEGDTPEQALYRVLNYFPTPLWGGRAGAEVLKGIDAANDWQSRIIYEPACGEGHMAVALSEYFPIVHASDIHDHGYGDVRDFLLSEDHPADVDWVVSNPPFEHAAAFIEKGMHVARRGVAMLLRIAFLEGTERYPLLYEGNNRLAVVAVFSERLPMVLGCYDPDASSAVCMAWFFFLKDYSGPTTVIAIPPGTKARLHRKEDVHRFAKLAPAPLLDVLA